ncbi:MAG: beta-glucosidase [Actinobacteria bacterium]|nr:beta-glucosidase [Actinomycetota bacterium]
MSKRVEDLLDGMTLEEQVAITSGRTMWSTQPVERLGVQRLRVSDGPAGVRGSRFDGPPSLNVPCGTAIAASWDPSLVRRLGGLLGRELVSKGARVHLAPTVNLHRTPVGGRNFECFSEDPYLSAVAAVQYVTGVQESGVGSCIKHFVGNDTEFERTTIDSRIDERTMRELYLVPFERAVRDAAVMSVMSAYNRLNGPYAGDSHWLLTTVLRDEWGFDGLVMSDWFGVKSTADAVNAGLDLEMPGPPVWRSEKLIAAVHAGEVTVETVRECARNVLTLLERTGGLDEPPGPEFSRDDAADHGLIREAGAAGMVLLRNRNDALPLIPGSLRSIAMVGPNAATGQIMGGGSAHVSPTRVSHPLDAISARLAAAGVTVAHAQGCNINKSLPEIDQRLVDSVVLEIFESPEAMDAGEAPRITGTTGAFRFNWFNDPLGRRGSHPYGVRLSMGLTPDHSGDWTFGVESVGSVRLHVDGRLILDNHNIPRGGSFFGTGKPEVSSMVSLEAGRRVDVSVEVRHVPTGMGLGGLNLGAKAPVNPVTIGAAVDAAASADATIVVVGTNDDWESEGWDRTDIALPGDQDELIRAVAGVSRRTIVVVNAGSPVAMPWLDEVDAVLVSWFPGQEFGEALTDVLVGEVEPGGRLPVTFPRRLEDSPAFEHHPGRNGVTEYREGRLIGYRWYDKTGREPLFEFGFGLGYADPVVVSASASGSHRVVAAVRNDGDRDGTQVVQVYAHLVDRTGLADDEPDQRLVGFAKVTVPAGTTRDVTVDLDVDAYRTWDLADSAWATWSGAVELRVGTSSRRIAERITIVL